MNINRAYKSMTTVAASIVVAFAATTAGAQAYTVTNLGFSGPAECINNSGQVAGEYFSGPGWVGVQWQNGVTTNLGSFGGPDTVPTGITASGQIVGRSTLQGEATLHHAFSWSSGVMTDLTPGSGANSEADGVNNSGQAIGFADENVPTLWQNGSSTTPSGLNGIPLDINNPGQIVSYVGSSAYVWTAGTEALVASDVINYEPLKLNDSGDVAGSFFNNGNMQAFTVQGGVRTNLGALLPNGQSRAFDIGNDGTVIGGSMAADGTEHAVMWKNGVLLDLNDLIAPGSNDVLGNARGINDLGQIVGVRRTGAFLLTPTAVPEPDPLFLFGGLGFFGFLKTRRGRK